MINKNIEIHMENKEKISGSCIKHCTLPISEGDEVMEQTLQFMEDFLNDEEIRDVYDKINDVERYAKEEGHATGHAEGLAQGLAKGEHQEKIKTAKNLLQMGLSKENISKATGLSMKQINALN